MFMGASLLSFIEIFYFCLLSSTFYFRTIVEGGKKVKGIIFVLPATGNSRFNKGNIATSKGPAVADRKY